MSKSSYTTDLLNAAKLAALSQHDEMLIYFIDMAIARSRRLTIFAEKNDSITAA